MTTRDKGITLPLSQPYVDLTSATGVKVTDAPSDYTSKNAYTYGASTLFPVNPIASVSSTPADVIHRAQLANASFGAIGGGFQFITGIGSAGNVSGVFKLTDSTGAGGGWNTAHYQMGLSHLWVDAAGRLRIKTNATAPTADTDGIVAGFDYIASAVYDPPSLADGVGVTTTIATAGAILGDFAIASFSLDLQGMSITAYVSSANIVSVRFQNESGGVLDLGSGTLKVKVIKQ